MVLQAATPLQYGVERMLSLNSSYYKSLSKKYEQRRDFLTNSLKEMKFEIK